MTLHVNIARAKATLSELIARAEAGEEIVLTRNGKPVARIKAEGQSAAKPHRRLGAWAHLGRMEDPYLFLRPDPELIEAAEASDEDGFYKP
jgi:antitoxin (DNA-binding transcriptional repressor) of toxin-antitoxin stability system